MNKINWKVHGVNNYNEFEITDGKQPAEFKILLQRQKYQNSKREEIIVKAQHYDKQTSSYEDCGELQTSLSNLGKDLFTLQEYGCCLLIVDFHSLHQKIRENFYDIPVIQANTDGRKLSKDIVKGIFGMYCHCMNKQQTQSGGKTYYYMDVKDFKEEFETSDYRIYDYLEVRKALRDMGYTKCNTDRTDLTIKILKNKNDVVYKKVIAFYADKVEAVEQEQAGGDKQ